MKAISEKAVATVAFVVALGGTLAVFPLILDNPAFAVDATGTAPDASRHIPLPSERIEPRLAYIRTALKITQAQAKQWNALADVLRKQAKDRDAEVIATRAYRDAKFTVIDRLEHRQTALTNRAAALSEIVAAAKPLYATLSDDQKQTADALLAPHFGRRGFGPHGWAHGDGAAPAP